MFLVKIKPLGWSLILLALICAGSIGFFLSRSSVSAHSSNSAADGAGLDGPPPPFSTSAQYPHVPATNPTVATALDAENLDGGEKLVGTNVTYLGHVVKIYMPASNAIHIINFAGNYHNTINAVIDAKRNAKFPDPQQLVGKQLLVTGKLIVFKKQLEIQLDSPSQLQIVDGSKQGAVQ